MSCRFEVTVFVQLPDEVVFLKNPMIKKSFALTTFRLKIYLRSLSNILHPGKFFGMGCGRDKDGLFPIIQVEAMFLTQTRLAVQDRHVFEHHLAVNTKV